MIGGSKALPDDLVESLRLELERALTNNKEKRDKVINTTFFVVIIIFLYALISLRKSEAKLRLCFETNLAIASY